MIYSNENLWKNLLNYSEKKSQKEASLNLCDFLYVYIP